MNNIDSNDSKSNNILFGDKSLIVSYIQAFLRKNYSTNVLPTNIYDQQTHQALINYLQQANVETLYNAEQRFKKEYHEFTTLFTLVRESNSLRFVSKKIDKQTSDFISLHLDDIKELADSIGWEVDGYNDYVDYTYDINSDNSVDEIDRSLLQTYLETRNWAL